MHEECWDVLPAIDTTREMYASIRMPWSSVPSGAETAYKAAGLVRTQGTIFLLPPDRDSLISAFNAPPRPKTRMSSGAVALCKHFERGGSSSENGLAHPFWPLPTGSNDNKSKMAAKTLETMLEDAAWGNMMLLHPGTAVYEIRNSLGYGMRWTLELEERDEVEELGDTAVDVVPQSRFQSERTTPNAEKDCNFRKVLFRGFLEPIAGMDHELLKSSEQV